MSKGTLLKLILAFSAGKLFNLSLSYYASNCF